MVKQTSCNAHTGLYASFDPCYQIWDLGNDNSKQSGKVYTCHVAAVDNTRALRWGKGEDSDN